MKVKFDRSGRPLPRFLAVALAVAFASAGDAWSLPVGEVVVAGSAAVTRPAANDMVIRQNSAAAIVNWGAFSIAPGEAVRIQQPGASSVILNRVVGPGRSDIFGRLSANGTVFLVNPDGILFGPSATVDVGALVASTLSITDADFLAGRYVFNGVGGAVINEGAIGAAERGTVALLGGSVRNDGTISARLGTVALGAGALMTLDLAGDGLSQLTITQGVLDALVENGHAVVADGGQVLLSARALGAVSGAVINQSGTVQAQSLTERNGRIVLDGGEAGATIVSGSLDATGAQSGTAGGEIQILGEHVRVVGTSTIDASGRTGGGSVLVGGDYQGSNAAVRNARTTVIESGASLRADAVENGNGGKLIVWSDEDTRAYGSFSARGGAFGGDGGMVETSGSVLDIAGARVSAAAPHGMPGSWLLDPTDLLIGNVEAAGISAALSGGTSVVVRTSDVDSEEPGDLTVAEGVEILHSGAAAVQLTLAAHRDILIDSGARIAATGAGSLAVDLNAGLTEESGEGRIILDGATIATNGGDLRMYGQSSPAAGSATGRVITTCFGSVCFDDYAPAVAIFGSLITSGVGAISIRGDGATGGAGVQISDTTIRSSSGRIDILGRGSNGESGVDLGFDTLIASGTGTLSITGEASGSSVPGLALGDADIGGDRDVTGDVQRGDVILRARNDGSADSIKLYYDSDGFFSSNIRTLGTLVLAPGGVSGGSVSVADAVPISVGGSGGVGFELDPDDLAAIDPLISSVVIGSSSHTGAISVTSGVSPLFDLTLQNEGGGSAGIDLAAGLSMPGYVLTLATAGPLSSGGPIIADELLVRGGAATAVSLNDPLNRVNRVAVDPPASFSFINSGPLVLGPISALGFSTSTNAVQALTATDSTSLGDFFVRTLAGTLTLDQDVTTLNAGASIDLIAATTFNNLGGTLTPGVDGAWRVWASTWVGEERGGLVPTFPMPNLYDCGYGSAGCPVGVAAASSGGHFIYADRPTITVIADDKRRALGAPNPPFTYAVSGLIFGDLATEAATGLLGTTALASSPVGSYPIDASSPFSSPVGYRIEFLPGTLTVIRPGGLDDETGGVWRTTPETSYLYDRNLGLPPMCMATGPVIVDGATQGNDMLSLEWSRVRQRPNLSNCVDVGEQNGCSDF